MRICVLHNRDHDLLEDDPGRQAREDVLRVAGAVTGALVGLGADVEVVPVGSNAVGFWPHLERSAPDVVVNLCESLAADSRGEMVVPCFLELLGIPYTGSSALSLGLALHKHKGKELLQARGIPTPEFRLFDSADGPLDLPFAFPAIVKPCREDASMGVTFDSVVGDKRQLARAVAAVIRDFHQPALVERFIHGREIYVPLVGNRPRQALPLTEIQFGKAFRDKPNIVSYSAKWESDAPECTDSPAVPCVLDPGTHLRVVQTAMDAFEALDCRDYGRVDIRLTDSGVPYVIDINPNCDLHPQAGFARAATASGMSYPDLAWKLVELALERSHGNKTHRSAGPRAPRAAVGPNRDLLSSRGGLRARAHRRRARAE